VQERGNRRRENACRLCQGSQQVKVNAVRNAALARCFDNVLRALIAAVQEERRWTIE